MSTMELLVSVRSVAEAEAALEGGAGLIDVKEPAHGSLGRAGTDTIAAIVQAVAGRRPVSAALGELLHEPLPYPGAGLTFVKWGLAGHGAAPRSWQHDLATASEEVERLHPHCRVVSVGYADWPRAGAPSLSEVADFARRRPGSVLLVDTWEKIHGRTLLDWLPLPALARLRHDCRTAGVRLALAGSLGFEEIGRLRPLRPDWFAVRGAACAGSDRCQAVSASRVRALVELLTVATPAG